jgi:hypothetical protein
MRIRKAARGDFAGVRAGQRNGRGRRAEGKCSRKTSSAPREREVGPAG